MLVAHDGELILRDEEMLAALGYEAVGFATGKRDRVGSSPSFIGGSIRKIPG
jgi:hypothetical protein